MAPQIAHPGFFTFMSPHSRRFREIVIITSVFILLLIWVDYTYNYSDRDHDLGRMNTKKRRHSHSHDQELDKGGPVGIVDGQMRSNRLQRERLRAQSEPESDNDNHEKDEDIPNPQTETVPVNHGQRSSKTSEAQTVGIVDGQMKSKRSSEEGVAVLERKRLSKTSAGMNAERDNAGAETGIEILNTSAIVSGITPRSFSRFRIVIPNKKWSKGKVLSSKAFQKFEQADETVDGGENKTTYANFTRTKPESDSVLNTRTTQTRRRIKQAPLQEVAGVIANDNRIVGQPDQDQEDDKGVLEPPSSNKKQKSSVGRAWVSLERKRSSKTSAGMNAERDNAGAETGIESDSVLNTRTTQTRRRIKQAPLQEVAEEAGVSANDNRIVGQPDRDQEDGKGVLEPPSSNKEQKSSVGRAWVPLERKRSSKTSAGMNAERDNAGAETGIEILNTSAIVSGITPSNFSRFRIVIPNKKWSKGKVLSSKAFQKFEQADETVDGGENKTTYANFTRTKPESDSVLNTRTTQTRRRIKQAPLQEEEAPESPAGVSANDNQIVGQPDQDQEDGKGVLEPPSSNKEQKSSVGRAWVSDT